MVKKYANKLEIEVTDQKVWKQVKHGPQGLL